MRWKKIRRLIGALVVLGGVLANLLAYKQAEAMLHFTDNGVRTAQPEELSALEKMGLLFVGVNIPKPRNHQTPTDYGLSYEAHQFNVDSQVELSAWYIPTENPSGLVVMFHGYAVSKSSLLPEAKAFNEMGYATFLVDFRGSGDSNQQETSLGYYEADDVIASVNYVQTELGIESVHLYGQSMGAVAILRAVTISEIVVEQIIIEAVFDRMTFTVGNRFQAMGLPSFPGTHILVFWGSVSAGYCGFRHNPVEYAVEVDNLVLMLHGNDDQRATLEQAKAVYENLSGKKQFEIFEGVGHESYFVAYPEQWHEVVGVFLNQ